MKNYFTERDGQEDFFSSLKIADIVETVDSNDGVYRGNIFEFKPIINEPAKTLYQAIKYLSKIRIKGKDLPANIICVSLNSEIAYVYQSQDYFSEIHEIYSGPASKDNEGFRTKTDPKIINYSSIEGLNQLLTVVQTNEFIKVNVDIHNIVSLATRYYNETNARKTDLFKEIRKPSHFKYINPYIEENNLEFKYLMDCLNDNIIKKKLGAFFTPIPYVKMAVEMLRQAISMVPTGDDYVIIDRCAGTGNLESELTEEELSHCILSTYEYHEWVVLNDLYKGQIRYIVPPTINRNKDVKDGLVTSADALAQKFVDDAKINTYLNDKKCTIILFENPPYNDVGNVETGGKTQNEWKQSYVLKEMKKEVRGTLTNELANLFIWSGFKFYLRQPTDYYVLFSKAQYWQTQKLINKKFLQGFICNRKHFHAGNYALTCILWKNIDAKSDIITLPVYDIADDKNIQDLHITVDVKQPFSLISKYYDRRVDTTDEKGIICGTNGYETHREARLLPKYNSNIIGYLAVYGFGFENIDLKCILTRVAPYGANGFYLRTDNLIDKLPLFCAGKYPVKRWWYKYGIINKSADGGDQYTKDSDFLKSCLIFTCLNHYNKCVSFTGSDSRAYRNELCFDHDTLASEILKKYVLNNEEEELLDQWKKVKEEAKKTKNYISTTNYGEYQIQMELNTYTEQEINGNKKKVYDYVMLNNSLKTLKLMLDQYYDNYIANKLFQYELLK
ncbi:MAG: hypothetical protein V1487_03595 [bacterium]